MLQPLVSVIIPTYDRKELVQQAIDSVLTQIYSHREVIVVDDGSTDGTGKTLAARYGDRIRYVWQENQGESVARNHGIELARGEYIALLDSDDLWLPEKLARQVAVLDANTDADMVFCQAWIINKQGQRIGESPHGAGLRDSDLALEQLCFENKISGSCSTAVVRRSVFDQIGGFDTRIRFAEDWDLWLRMARHCRPMIIQEPLACIRQHRGTQSYYPSAEQNAQRLADHLTILEKAFASWSGKLPTGLRRRAIAYQYAQAFLAEETVGNIDAATENLLAAVQLAPDLLNDTALFGKHVVNCATIIVEQRGQVGLEFAVDFVQRVFRRLHSVGMEDELFERKVIAAAYAALGFMAHKRNERRVTRHCFLQAICHDQSWLQNLGLLSTLAESFVGERTLSTARLVARWFRRAKSG
jgi:hypothetical protein